jgi:pilus assembly protein CpaB
MAKRRVVAAVVALLLAGGAGLVLVGYVKGADQRALKGMEGVRVLVVAKSIKGGSASETLGQAVATELMPARTVVAGALTSLSAVHGQVTTSDLVPGEQLLASRFANPASLLPPGQVRVPSGMQEVTVALDSQKALGGNLTAGDRVGIVMSIDKDGTAPARSQTILHKVLVSRVSGGNGPAEPTGGKSDKSPAAETVVVTFAVSAHDAEKVVFAANYGKPWLSRETVDADVTGTVGVTVESVNR